MAPSRMVPPLPPPMAPPRPGCRAGGIATREVLTTRDVYTFKNVPFLNFIYLFRLTLFSTIDPN